jgi:hypothetical protein
VSSILNIFACVFSTPILRNYWDVFSTEVLKLLVDVLDVSDVLDVRVQLNPTIEINRDVCGPLKCVDSKYRIVSCLSPLKRRLYILFLAVYSPYLKCITHVPCLLSLYRILSRRVGTCTASIL